ncbi:bromodomain-containing protein DDB_G0270170-like [Polistes fuscatus]|uniref:bromodomain-containing protein DDB_G0270170-like n=1 Tax=Polistes fuscatus TaxID=30207 RepID=UPI001CA7F772|nr:bromodomain-containing protein DDB_G0270170-like [Polistes fuscatus]
MTGKRLKRSANENSNSSAEMKNNLKLYRHPKLTQEDEKSKITDTNVNVYTDFYKRIWEIINDTRPTFKIVVPPMRTHREIFKDEDVTSGSEIEDLNFPYKETGSLNEKKKLFIGIPFDERRPPEEDEFDKYVKVDMENVDNCSTLKPIVESKNEMIIINPDEVYVDSKETKDLSDNKSSTNDSTKLKKYSFSSMPVEKLDNNKLVPSVPDYDPDKIPYVEIPDYSDEREESLDEEDRRLAKEQYIDPNNFSNISNNYTDKITTLGYEYSDKNNNEDANKDQSILTRGATNIKLSETSNHEKKNHLKKNNKNVRSQSEVRKNTDEGFVLPEIQFDINEYNKPFDLDDFLKSEHPTREDLVDDDEWEPRYKRANENTRMDHMKLDYTKDQGRIDEMINEEKDFLERYFSKDVIDKLEEHSDEEFGEETKRKEKEEEKKKKTLKTLSTILDKKDRISRLDEEVNKEIEENGRKVPSVYKNYWSLEYELPGMKDIKKEMKKIY